MFCAPVYTFISGSSALLGGPRCGLLISRYLPYSTQFSEFTSIFVRRKRTKHENTGPPFLYDNKMATVNGYWARKALILREPL